MSLRVAEKIREGIEALFPAILHSVKGNFHVLFLMLIFSYAFYIRYLNILSAKPEILFVYFSLLPAALFLAYLCIHGFLKRDARPEQKVLFLFGTAVFSVSCILLVCKIFEAGDIVPRILSYDPVYQYRFTRYFVEFGFFPEWDELSYYVGRPYYMPPLMYYLTGILHLFLRIFAPGMSLLATCAFASALYGALIAIPAYLLGRELSNKWGGVLAGALVGFAPQILSRTFGSSYDSDQLVLFFILLTLWSGIRMIRKPNTFNFLLSLFAFTAFMLTWHMFWYTFAIIAICEIVLFAINLAKKRTQKNNFKGLVFLILSFIALIGVGTLLRMHPLKWFLGMFQIATKPEVWIVNVSIAELQPVGLNLGAVILSFGKFVTGISTLDNLLLATLISSIFAGIALKVLRREYQVAVIFAVLLCIGLLTVLRGIRFTEFSAVALLVLSAAGFGEVYSLIKGRRFFENLWRGAFLSVLLLAFSCGLQYAQYLGPDADANWDNAWKFLREQTPELALVGTWWDPGHMITGYAERRVIADGAHCGFDCMYTINDRITDLGKIFTTANEKEALRILRKYQGTSPEIYWIASADLIGKFQWLQYFGTGCDARYEWQKCPLYGMAYRQNVYYSQEGKPLLYDYGSIKVLDMGGILLPFYVRGRNAALFKEVIFFNQTSVPAVLDFSRYNFSAWVEQLKPVFANLQIGGVRGLRLSSQPLDYTVWISEDKSYIATIPPHLRKCLFTRMFFLNGAGLKYFKLVYMNPEVKIFRVEPVALENVTSL